MTSTPVPPGYVFTWSYSSLSTFEICPRKWWAEKVAKTAPYESNAAADWGTEVHEQLEHRAQDGAPLPSNMAQYQHALDKVRALAGMAQDTRYEYKMGLTRDGLACDFDAPEMFGRAISDVFLRMTPETAFVVDWKTGGRYYGPTLQPVVNAKLVFAHFPEVQIVKTSWAYLKVGYTEMQTYTRDKIDKDFFAVEHVVQQMEIAIEHQNFPARRGFLCRSYCSDFSCPHNGRKGPVNRLTLD